MEEETNNQVDKFYNFLREKDREFVQATVGRLKEEGFDVYVTGSSLKGKNYRDIDLVITPREGMTHNDSLNGLERAIQGIDGVNIIDRTKDPAYSDSLLPFPNKPMYVGSEVESRVILHSTCLNSENPEYKKRYVGSLVSKRNVLYQFLDKQIADTKSPIDITLTHEPFGIIPETERIKL